MKKRIFLLVTVSAILIPSASTECEQGELDDLYLVLMKYNMKHDRAEELYNNGIYSEYATKISQRTWELEVLHEQRGEQP